jgi:hypothetical protein
VTVTEYYVATKARFRAALFIMGGAGFVWGLAVGAVLWR